MKRMAISLTAMSLFIFSCGNTYNEKSNKKKETITHEEPSQNKEMETIELNGEEKWKVDTNMITHIRNMENDINSLANVEKRDYKVLAEKLQSNIDLLTSNCTMKGKAHDELHKWLLPYIDLVKLLSEAKHENEAAIQFEEIQNSFTIFNQYFQ